MNPLIVGELNPYGTEGRYALYPYPENSAGGRLCRKVLGLRPGRYVHAYDRVNLCAGKWSVREARARAAEIHAARWIEPGVIGRLHVLLGAKVCAAFGVPHEPFSYVPAHADEHQFRRVVLPHPSGRCRAWNDPQSYGRARFALAVAGCPVGEWP